MNVVISLAAKERPRPAAAARRRLPDGRSAQVLILPCIRREAIGEGGEPVQRHADLPRA